MSRYVPVALVATLLVATGAAFAYTERLKLTPSPILGTSVTNKIFSPVCDCDTDVAVVGFRLRERDRIDVEIVDGGGGVVRKLVLDRPVGRGPIEVVWNGRDDAGAVVREGSYRPRVRLERQRKTITLPNPIRVDVTPPNFERFSLSPRVFSPDGDGRKDVVAARYALDERAQVGLYVDGRRQVLKRGTRPEGVVQWFGLVDGEPVAAGTYRVSLGATDVAGNVAQRTRPGLVVARFVVLARNRIEVVVGQRFAVFVASDAARVRWRLARRTGTAPPGSLRLRAPDRAGRYALVVRAAGHADRAVVVVRERPAAAE